MLHRGHESRACAKLGPEGRGRLHTDHMLGGSPDHYYTWHLQIFEWVNGE